MPNLPPDPVPQRERMPLVALRIPQELLDEIDRLAVTAKTSRSGLLRSALQKLVEDSRHE